MQVLVCYLVHQCTALFTASHVEFMNDVHLHINIIICYFNRPPFTGKSNHFFFRYGGDDCSPPFHPRIVPFRHMMGGWGDVLHFGPAGNLQFDACLCGDCGIIVADLLFYLIRIAFLREQSKLFYSNRTHHTTKKTVVSFCTLHSSPPPPPHLQRWCLDCIAPILSGVKT